VQRTASDLIGGPSSRSLPQSSLGAGCWTHCKQVVCRSRRGLAIAHVLNRRHAEEGSFAVVGVSVGSVEQAWNSGETRGRPG